MTHKQVTIDQFLTRDEIVRCYDLYREMRDTGRYASAIEEEIIGPNMVRINKALGQENNARYLAYCIEYAMGRVVKL